MVILTLPVWTSNFNHVCSLLLAIPSPTPHIHTVRWTFSDFHMHVL